MPEVDRNYYRQVWGFDPVTDRITLPGKFQYRSEFPLPKDQGLTAVGVKIAAEVTFTARGEVLNHIIFKRGKRETHINCTHTVIYSGSVEDALTLAQDGILGRFRTPAEQILFSRVGTARLVPEEHFVALRSYVAAIAEAGIENLLGAGNPPSWDDQDLGMSQPFGFNAAMRSQVVAALRGVAPSAAEVILRNIFAELVTTAGSKWFQSRLVLLDGLYFHSLIREIISGDFVWKAGMSEPFAQFLLEDPNFFEIIFEAAPISNLIRSAVHWPNTPPGVFACIVTYARVEAWIDHAFLQLEDLKDLPFEMGSESRLFYEMTHYYSIARMPPEGSLDLKLLRGFPEEMKWVKKHKSMLGFWTIHHPHFPTALLVTFARHPDVGLRAAVPLHRGVGTDLLTELGSDPSPHVRLAVACNAKTPLSVLDLLKHDPNSNVRMAATHTSQIAES